MLCLQVVPVNAHHGGGVSGVTGIGLAGPILTIPAYTLPEGKFLFGTGINYTHADRFSRSKINQFLRNGTKSHNTGDILTPSLFAAYGLSDKLTILFDYPYQIKYDIDSTISGFELKQGNSIGFGDLTVLGQYKFLDKEKHGLQSALLLGLKIPTGETDERDSFGIRIAADEQPGSGSWDPLFGLAVSKSLPKSFSAHSNVMYKLTTDGSQNTDVGDLFNYNLAIAHRVGPESGVLQKVFPKHLLGQDLLWDLVLEFNGQWSETVEVNNIEDINHGGNLIFLSPGIRLVMNDDLVFNLASSVQVFEDLNGNQTDPDLQLSFSISKLF